MSPKSITENTLFYGDNLHCLLIQILTVEQLLDGARVDMPPTGMTFKVAQKVKDGGAEQGKLFESKT